MTVAEPSGARVACVLRATGISKRFGSTRALRQVSLELRAGEIHALVGGNGSGKSTLIKVLAGVHPADEGDLEVAGARFDARSFSPQQAHDAGLRFVHQQPSVFDELTVAENLAAGAGFARTRIGRIRWREVDARAAAVLERFEIPLHPRAPMRALSPALRMMVAIARALQDQDELSGGVLVLDEATAALTAPEVEVLLDALRRYARAGRTIVVVTHRIDELTGFADRLTALRDGRVVATADAARLDHDEIVDLICGPATLDEAEPPAERRRVRAGSPALRVADLHVGRVAGVSFDAYPGEILGVAGSVGSGRTTLLTTIFGQRRAQAGTIRLDGAELDAGSPHRAVERGIAYLPEDRGRLAAFPDMTVGENLSAAVVGTYWKGLRLRHRDERRAADDLVDRFRIRTAGSGALLGTLSGGNQQKVMLARWMRREPRVLMLDDPTQGVDVGARREIYRLIRHASASGAVVLLVSSDFEELAELADRVLVLVNGRLTRSYEDGASAEQLHRAALSGTGER